VSLRKYGSRVRLKLWYKVARRCCGLTAGARHRYPFRSLVASLRAEAGRGSTVYFWLDVVSVNQHMSTSFPSTWWSGIFRCVHHSLVCSGVPIIRWCAPVCPSFFGMLRCVHHSLVCSGVSIILWCAPVCTSLNIQPDGSHSKMIGEFSRFVLVCPPLEAPPASF
jgi:hypothetical protein